MAGDYRSPVKYGINNLQLHYEKSMKTAGKSDFNWTADPEDEGKRLDQFLADRSGMTRSQAQKLIERGLVLVSGHAARKNHKVKPGDRVSGTSLHEVTTGLEPQDIPLSIVYKDNDIIVIDKPPGLVMYPAAGHSQNTLMNGVAFHSGKLASVGAPLRPGVVHRIDRETSGLVVVALNDAAYYALQEQFREHSIIRRYLAIVHGRLKTAEGEIDRPIGRSTSDRKKMSTKTRRGKSARTFYRVIEEYEPASLIEARLATGRTHQIRVHLSSMGHPILGDSTYGKKTAIRLGDIVVKVARQMLHAETLGFIHPSSGREVLFTAPLPDDMRELLRTLTRNT